MKASRQIAKKTTNYYMVKSNLIQYDPRGNIGGFYHEYYKLEVEHSRVYVKSTS